MDRNPWVVVGQIGVPYGIKGWVHVRSFTDPVENLMQLTSLHISSADETWHLLDQIRMKKHNRGLIANVEHCDSRLEAEYLKGKHLAVLRGDLPEASEDEVYWVDLIGASVVNVAGEQLGKVTQVTHNGASSMIEVANENKHYLIPMVRPVLQSMQLPDRVIVDWDSDWLE